MCSFGEKHRNTDSDVTALSVLTTPTKVLTESVTTLTLTEALSYRLYQSMHRLCFYF